MAGFIDRLQKNSTFKGVSDNLVKLSNFGMQYQDMVVKNSKAVGVTEASMAQRNIWDQDLQYVLSFNDIGKQQFIAYYYKDYPSRREYLRQIAQNSEIDFILDIIADEAISYSDSNYFCQPTLTGNWDQRIVDGLYSNFKKIYANFNFNNTINAWSYFKQLLIDGFLTFENIWNEEGTKIIGFKELDASSVRPDVERNPDGTFRRVWHQYENQPNMYKKIYEPNITYISFTKNNLYGRVSYVERLIRSFNLLRTMENSRVLWNLINSTFRMKMVVPVGSKSPARQRESLGQLMAIYKEDISLDNTSGELFVGGRPGIQAYRNYIVPNKSGEQIEIDTLEPGGHDLSNVDDLRYFSTKLIRDSRVPFSRFDDQNNGGSYSLNAEGVEREEIRFFNFIVRLRSIFQEVIINPLYWQMLADFPTLRGDENFRTNLGIAFNKLNRFDEMKDIEVTTKQLEFIVKMADLKNGEKQIFPTEWLIKKYMKTLTKDDLDEIKKAQNPILPEDEDSVSSASIDTTAAPAASEEGSLGGT